MALAFLVLLFGVDGVYVTAGLADSLSAARQSLQDGADALGDSDPAAAARAFEEAAGDGRRAVSLTRHPSLNLLSLSPWAGADARGVIAIARATELSARAGVAAANAAATLRLTRDGLAASVYENGRVDLDALAEAEPFVADADESLTEAAALLLGAPRADISGFATLLDRARTEVADAQRSARRVHALVSALPSLLGAGETRRYLLAFQTLSEARGTGGVIGLYGVLRASDGDLKLEDVGPYRKAVPPRVGPVDAPAWFEANYGPQSALTEWPQANVSPNFEVTSEVLLNLFEAGTGQRLDGVLAMDPVVMAAMLEATGPIKTPDGREINAANAKKVLLHDTYVDHPVDDPAQDLFLAALIRTFWERIDSGDVDMAVAADRLGEMIRQQHLRLYATDREDQTALRELDANGRFSDYGPNVQLVFHQNYTANKVDYFLTRTVDTRVHVESDGGARVSVTASLENSAPTSPVTQLNRPNRPADPPGMNRMLLSFLLPQGADVGKMTIGGDSSAPLAYEDTGYPVAWSIVEIPPGSSKQVKLTYSIPRLVTDRSPDLVLFPQVTANPDRYSVTVTADDAIRVSVGDRQLPPSADLRDSGELAEPKVLEFTTGR